MTAKSRDKNVCLECIGEYTLREQLKARAGRLKCSFCDRKGRAISITELAKHIDPYLRMLLCAAEEQGQGDPLYDRLGSLLEVDATIAEVLEWTLHRDTRNTNADSFYDEAWSYHKEDDRNVREDLTPSWLEFEESVKHKSRFFNVEAMAVLDRLTGGRDELEAGSLAVHEIGPGPGKGLYRARLAPDRGTAQAYLQDPMKELGPPPKKLATAGRMNAHGVSVFYGAFSETTAIAELRPPVGGYVSLASFRPTRHMLLLDLSNIHLYPTMSPFAHDYRFQIGRKVFFEDLHARIMQPVLPGTESLEYLPTQAFADYVANVLKLDGILYGSTQVGALPDPWQEDKKVAPEKCNVVLLNVSHGSDAIICMPNSQRSCQIASAEYKLVNGPWINRNPFKRELKS